MIRRCPVRAIGSPLARSDRPEVHLLGTRGNVARPSIHESVVAPRPLELSGSPCQWPGSIFNTDLSERDLADYTSGPDRRPVLSQRRHGPARPGHPIKARAVPDGPDEPGHDG
jgi:hypothetical protein